MNTTPCTTVGNHTLCCSPECNCACHTEGAPATQTTR